MSTVPEVIVAAHTGLKVLAFSVVTDLCLPDALQPAVIAHILETAAKGGERLNRLIPEVVRRLPKP
jgi:purine-nucleoside phosphorylase